MSSTDGIVSHDSSSPEALFRKVLDELNPEQRQAVEAIDGPVLVLAGPGTGKTQVLAARIGYLLQHPDLQCMPENILCLTFTEAGALAMRRRLVEFIGPTAHRVSIYTFHGYCNDLILNYPDLFGTPDYEPISDLERLQLMKSLLDQLDKEHPLKKFKGRLYSDVNRLNHLFQTMKEEDWSEDFMLKTIDQYLEELPEQEGYTYKRANKTRGIRAGDPNPAKIGAETEKMEKLKAGIRLFSRMQEKMSEARRYDYTDMISWVLRAFRSHPFLLQLQQERYRYFLVDEYQDTNGSQNEILNLLTGFWEKPDVFVVGDDDQSIYRFQGANVKNITEFCARHRKHLQSIVLTRNYRSSQEILDSAMHLISVNRDRLIYSMEGLEKKLTANHLDFSAPHPLPRILEFPSRLQEEYYVLQTIEQLQKEGIDLREVAVIYRQHQSADNLMRIFDQKGIPYQTSRKTDVLGLPFIGQILSVMTYVNSESRKILSGESLLFPILHYRFLGLDVQDLFRLAITMENKNRIRNSWRELLGDHLALSTLGLNNVEALIRFDNHLTGWLQDLHNLPLQQWLEKMVYESGLLDALLGSPQRVWKMEALNTFFSFVKSESNKRKELTLAGFLESIALMQENDLRLNLEKTIHHDAGVHLMTAHKSKGLEFTYVFLINATKDQWEGGKRGGVNRFSFPSAITSAREENDAEESRRLFYVAMTRARKELIMTYALAREERESERCLFLDELLTGSSLQVEKPQADPEGLVHFNAALLSSPPDKPMYTLEKEKIDGILQRYKMNVTHLNRYLECPVAFFYEHILRVPKAENEHMAFGTVIHNALRKLFEKRKEENNAPGTSDEEQLIRWFKEDMQKRKAAFTSLQWENRLHYGEKVLRAYYRHYKDQWQRVVVTEYHIRNVEIEGVPVTGTLDKIEFHGNEVNVVDYKTGKVEEGRKKLRPPQQENPDGGNYWRQLIFYKLLVDADHRTPWVMRSGEIDFVEMDDRGKFVKEQMDIRQDDEGIVRAQVKDTYAKIMNQQFGPGCGEEHCTWCRMEGER